MGPQSDLAVLPAPEHGRAHPSKARFCDASVLTQPPQPQLKRERGVGRAGVGDARRADASVPGAAPLKHAPKACRDAVKTANAPEAGAAAS